MARRCVFREFAIGEYKFKVSLRRVDVSGGPGRGNKKLRYEVYVRVHDYSRYVHSGTYYIAKLSEFWAAIKKVLQELGASRWALQHPWEQWGVTV